MSNNLTPLYIKINRFTNIVSFYSKNPLQNSADYNKTNKLTTTKQKILDPSYASAPASALVLALFLLAKPTNQDCKRTNAKENSITKTKLSNK